MIRTRPSRLQRPLRPNHGPDPRPSLHSAVAGRVQGGSDTALIRACVRTATDVLHRAGHGRSDPGPSVMWPTRRNKTYRNRNSFSSFCVSSLPRCRPPSVRITRTVGSRAARESEKFARRSCRKILSLSTPSCQSKFRYESCCAANKLTPPEVEAAEGNAMIVVRLSTHAPKRRAC